MTDPGKLGLVFNWGVDAGELWLGPWNLSRFAQGIDPFCITAKAHLKDFGQALVDGDIKVSETFICVVIGPLFRRFRHGGTPHKDCEHTQKDDVLRGGLVHSRFSMAL